MLTSWPKQTANCCSAIGSSICNENTFSLPLVLFLQVSIFYCLERFSITSNIATVNVKSIRYCLLFILAVTKTSGLDWCTTQDKVSSFADTSLCWKLQSKAYSVIITYFRLPWWSLETGFVTRDVKLRKRRRAFSIPTSRELNLGLSC